MGIINYFVNMTTESGLSPSIPIVILITFFMVVYLGGAFIAVTIAEVRFHSRLIHFLGALFLPIIYPVLIYFVLPQKSLSLEDDVDDLSSAPPDDEDTFKLQEEEEAAAEEAAEDEMDENGEPIVVMNQQYFASIAVDEAGNHMGPFIIELDDGSFLEAAKIVNPMPEIVIIEIASEGKSRTLRIPYSKITNCCFKSDWLEES